MTADKSTKGGSWKEFQRKLAEESGLAIVLSQEDGLSELASSNKNSICKVLTSSDEFRPQCERFCGKVHSAVKEADNAVRFKCHAGLECVAVPLKSETGKEFVGIVGRAFTKASDYKKATERAISGDWKKFAPTRFFNNVLLTSSNENIAKLAKELSKPDEEKAQLLDALEAAQESPGPDKKPGSEKPGIQDVRMGSTVDGEKRSGEEGAGTGISREIPRDENLDKLIEEFSRKADKDPAIIKDTSDRARSDSEELAAWRRFIASIHDLEYGDACMKILEFVSARYNISSVAWLENIDNHLKKVLALGALEDQKIRISIPTSDDRLVKVFRKQSSIELRERNGKNADQIVQTIRLFPIAVRDRIRGALVLGEEPRDIRVRRHVSRFCQIIASELEIVRLRGEVREQGWLDTAFSKFNDSLTVIDTSHFWLSIIEVAAELVKAERGSLLVYDEKGEDLVVRAAIGGKADFIEKADGEIGERIAKNVWKSGKPLVVKDIDKIGLPPAPPEWEYSTGSFISFPLSIGERRVGVLNVTDKTDGGIFDESDLRLLTLISPQLAVAIDRASLKSKAGEFEQLSVTDPLTGLLNRRYLEERLNEEIKRSDRHGYPMSFLMIDVDEFKSYNDEYTHPEGDRALKLVGQCLRESLRDADVAARYGGEEFSILLPQTNLEEARTIAERIRDKIAKTRFPNRQVTVSIGITGASSTRDTALKIISAADKALFEAKRRGRNNVQIYEYVRKNLKIGY